MFKKKTFLKKPKLSWSLKYVKNTSQNETHTSYTQIGT